MADFEKRTTKSLGIQDFPDENITFIFFIFFMLKMLSLIQFLSEDFNLMS